MIYHVFAMTDYDEGVPASAQYLGIAETLEAAFALTSEDDDAELMGADALDKPLKLLATLEHDDVWTDENNNSRTRQLGWRFSDTGEFHSMKEWNEVWIAPQYPSATTIDGQVVFQVTGAFPIGMWKRVE